MKASHFLCFLYLFWDHHHWDMSLNWILNLSDSFFSWSCTKGCKQNEVPWRSPWPSFIFQSNSWLAKGSSNVLTMRHLICSRNYCLLTCLSKEKRQCAALYDVSSWHWLEFPRTTAILHYEILRQKMKKKFKWSFQRTLLFIMIYFSISLLHLCAVKLKNGFHFKLLHE